MGLPCRCSHSRARKFYPFGVKVAFHVGYLYKHGLIIFFFPKSDFLTNVALVSRESRTYISMLSVGGDS